MTISLPEEDRSYLSKRYMEDQIVALLGGRVAEAAIHPDIQGSDHCPVVLELED